VLENLVRGLRGKYIVCFALLVCLFAVQLGCGGSSDRIKPAENPTPLPDPDSRLEFGGPNSNTPANSRKIER
jgi:hypothetical protein